MNRPLIAVLTLKNDQNRMEIHSDYLDAIISAGGVPVVLPICEGEATADVIALAEHCDGYLFSGGGDIDPSYYGEANDGTSKNICSLRDRFEFEILGKIYPSGKPILGICRGEQLLNVFFGGSLHQHVDGHVQNERRHVRTHSVKLNDGGFLSGIIDRGEIEVNSFHHQAVRTLGKGLIADATSSDGFVEAFYAPGHKFCLGVQWHPENYHRECPTSSEIFKAFIAACEPRLAETR